MMAAVAQTAVATHCQKHIFEDATGKCRSCRAYFCDDCLVYAHGQHAAPFCIPCALAAAGVRSTAARSARPRRRLFGRREQAA
jgi:hypothetical protein